MLDKGNRICPCCGKPLKLIPPTKELLPNRVGVSSNFVEYYFPSGKRFFSITSRPRSRYKQAAANSLTYSGNLNKNHILFDKSGWNIVPVRNTLKKLESGGLRIFSHEMVFFCKSCERKLSVNRNPLAFFSSAVGAFFIAAVVVSILITLSVIPLFALFFLGAALLLLLLEAVSEWFFTVKYFSNFVPTDEYDSLIYPETHFTLSVVKKSGYLREGNVFQSELDGMGFYVYLVRKTENPEFHICGTAGEPERLLALIREKRERGETVTLPLTFEGKFVGNAEVLEIYVNK